MFTCVATTFRHILFPVAFSEPCLAVLPFVKGMADCLGARATALHAIYDAPLPVGPSFGPAIVPQDYEAAREPIAARLNAVVASVSSEIAVVCEQGDAARVIGEYVKTHQVDVIMMPTHGHGPFRRMLLGSLTAKVLHDVDCPVRTTARTGDLR